MGDAEEFKTFHHGKVLIFYTTIQLSLSPPRRTFDRRHSGLLELRISCRELALHLSSLAQVFSSSPLISTLDELELREANYRESSLWEFGIKNAQWSELLRPCATLKNLYLTHGVAQGVCGALRELSGEMATEVLPALRNLFVQGFESLQPIQEAMMPLVSARQLSGHPLVVDRWIV